jgi:hypothetical protein
MFSANNLFHVLKCTAIGFAIGCAIGTALHWVSSAAIISLAFPSAAAWTFGVIAAAVIAAPLSFLYGILSIKDKAVKNIKDTSVEDHLKNGNKQENKSNSKTNDLIKENPSLDNNQNITKGNLDNNKIPDSKEQNNDLLNLSDIMSKLPEQMKMK